MKTTKTAFRRFLLFLSNGQDLLRTYQDSEVMTMRP